MSPQSSCFCYIQSRILYLSSPIFLFLVQVFTVRLARRPEVQTPFLSFLLVFFKYRVACIFIWRVFPFLLMGFNRSLVQELPDHKFTLNTSSPTSAVSCFLFPLFFFYLYSFLSFMLPSFFVSFFCFSLFFF